MTVQIIPISDVRQNFKGVLARLEATGEPYFITQYSRPKAVLVRYQDYSALQERAADEHPRIVRRPDISGGEPIIRGTRITVRHIVERVRAAQSAEDILAALPHLTAAQVYDALSYYHDHQAEIDQRIEAGQPDRIAATQSLRVEPITDGVAVVHHESGRW